MSNSRLKKDQCGFREAQDRLGFGDKPKAMFEEFCETHRLVPHKYFAQRYFQIADIERVEAQGFDGFGEPNSEDQPPETLTEAQRVALEERLDEQERRRRLLFLKWRRENGRWVRAL